MSDIKNSEQSNTLNYVNKIGNTTFIINNYFTGSKTLADAFEEIIVSTFRQNHAVPVDNFTQPL